MIRNTGLLLAVLLLGIAIGAGGWLLGSSPSHAQVDEAAVVSAVAIDWVEDYEPDPFDDSMLRRSTVKVKQIALVRADGTVSTKRVKD
ncbi:MAG TPA: hypothetical protein QGH10_00575 [Armatimonadota bacterium]|nr:hypothetical protein [Armatimonadota bacterium]